MGGVFSAAANAADGVVKFTGNITADACKVGGESAGAIDVSLGTVTSASLPKAGDKSDPTKFTIALSDCPDTLTKASIKFDGTSDATNPALLKLDAGSTASGVGIEIAQANGSALPLFTASTPVDIASGTANLDFVGRYVATKDAPTPGSANGTSQFTIAYN